MPKQPSATTSAPTSTGSGATPSSPTPPPAASDVSILTPATPAAPTADPLDVRYTAGDGVEPWMIGKSARDVAVITQQLYNQLVQGQLSNSAQPFSLEPPPTQMYTPTPPVPAPPVPPSISEPQRE